jgi:hypothetical protein
MAYFANPARPFDGSFCRHRQKSGRSVPDLVADLGASMNDAASAALEHGEWIS